MTERSIDELGPVDYLIVEFPAGIRTSPARAPPSSSGSMTPGSSASWTSSSSRRPTDGTVMAQELGDLADLGELGRLETELVQTLAEEDVDHLAAAMDPGSIAGVLVYENLWAAPFGRPCAGRADSSSPTAASPSRPSSPRSSPMRHSKLKESEMPGRAGRGVIGAPVAKAAVVGAAVKPGPRPSPRPPSSEPPSRPDVARRQGGGRGSRRHAGSPPLLVSGS